MSQAFSVPGAEQLQKLLSVGPSGYIFSNNCSKSNDNPKGKHGNKLQKLFCLGVRALFRVVSVALLQVLLATFAKSYFLSPDTEDSDHETANATITPQASKQGSAWYRMAYHGTAWHGIA